MTTPQALHGLRVVDLSTGIAGPYCTKLLTDYGAEVLKVERPRGGDATRRDGPFRAQAEADHGALFAYLNAGKLGVTLDERTATGRALLLQLVREADVVVESSGPGVMESLGLGHAALAGERPGVVLCSITPFGQSGPYRDRAWSELSLQALGGVVYLTGEKTREPLGIPLDLAQYLGGTQAYIGILGAERIARATGRGEHVDVSLFEALVSLQDPILAAEAYSGDEQQREGYRHHVGYPGMSFACKDGWVYAFGALQEDWVTMTAVMGRPELGTDPRFQAASARKAHAVELDAAIGAWTAEHTASEIYHTMQGRRVPFAMIATAKELLASEHLSGRGFFDTIDYGGPVTVPGAPFRLALRGERVVRRAPQLGEHNEAILCGRLGLAPRDLPPLFAAGVI